MAKNKLSSSRRGGAKKEEIKELTPEEQEKALQKLRKGKERGKYYGRVTVDFPHDVYDEMKEFVEEDGKTLKGYIVHLVKKHLKGIRNT